METREFSAVGYCKVGIEKVQCTPFVFALAKSSIRDRPTRYWTVLLSSGFTLLMTGSFSDIPVIPYSTFTVYHHRGSGGGQHVWQHRGAYDDDDERDPIM